MLPVVRGRPVSHGHLKQAQRFHEPLVEGESPRQTAGCRHRSPNTCSKHSMASACALVRADDICLAPPGSWPKQFERLSTVEHNKLEDKRANADAVLRPER
jgi:hypothetical protein